MNLNYLYNILWDIVNFIIIYVLKHLLHILIFSIRYLKIDFLLPIK